jgi:Mn-dependent DtxR family transcriptional regulator
MESGDTRVASTDEAAAVLGLTRARASEVLRDLEAAGFIRVSQRRVRATAAGVSLGVEVATSRKRIHELAVSPRGPYWTYIPEEVNLKRQWS